MAWAGTPQPIYITQKTCPNQVRRLSYEDREVWWNRLMMKSFTNTSPKNISHRRDVFLFVTYDLHMYIVCQVIHKWEHFNEIKTWKEACKMIEVYDVLRVHEQTAYRVVIVCEKQHQGRNRLTGDTLHI